MKRVSKNDMYTLFLDFCEDDKDGSDLTDEVNYLYSVAADREHALKEGAGKLILAFTSWLMARDIEPTLESDDIELIKGRVKGLSW